jgi:SAM-dependent methyltransferase
MDLRERWEAEASQWIAWARRPGHDSYWTRDLKALGHEMVGIDTSPSLVAAARQLDPSMDIRLADATALPFDDASVDLVVAFMSLHDIDAMSAAVREAARGLETGGRFCLAIVHPINSAGRFETRAADASFVIKGDYLAAFNYADAVERDGLSMTFHSRHRPIETYFRALEEAGLLVEALREPKVPDHAIVAESSRRWQRLPLFLHLRARRP